MSGELGQLQDEIIKLCAKLNQKNMLAAGDGNVSVRLSENSVLITARGKNKAFISRDDFAVVNLDGEVLEGEPSTEVGLHLEVYTTCPKAQAVMHAHPPHLIGYSIAHPYAREIPTAALPEVILGIGSIPIAPYGRPGTRDLSRSVSALLRNGQRAMVLARHGALVWGETLMESYNGLERMEHAAMVLACSHAFGRPVDMEAKELSWLKEQHQQRGRTSL